MDYENRSWSPRNVRLRFFLGPTSVGIMRCADDVMEEYPVIIHQVDFRFDVYGSPVDIAQAITESFLMLECLESNSTEDNLTNNSRDEEPLSPPRRRSGESNDEDSLSRRRNNNGQQQQQQQQRDPLSDQLGSISLQDQEMRRLSATTSTSTNDGRHPDQQGSLPFYHSQTLVPGGRRARDTRARKLKTDYHLEQHRQEHPNPLPNHSSKERRPLIIMLCLRERIAHHLLHRTGGFMSYLVRHADLEACAKDEVSFEELESVATSAGMSIGLSGQTLPGNTEIPIWLQVCHKEALRVILHGLLTALSEDPLYHYERNLLSDEESNLRIEWDSKLLQRSLSSSAAAARATGIMMNEGRDDGWVTSSQNKTKQREEEEERFSRRLWPQQLHQQQQLMYQNQQQQLMYQYQNQQQQLQLEEARRQIVPQSAQPRVPQNEQNAWLSPSQLFILYYLLTLF
ncbi:hypothetical protein BGZ65_002869 [Modicella reniformis]|uniref:Uncharacterized protein n=1 Tax=Modicella reniformis TaxID=1440133 RepID=A0A9P6J3E0_9FUNG|nr:hypothetical protein BGZ65_002869 [Modicella reniformis]